MNSGKDNPGKDNPGKNNPKVPLGLQIEVAALRLRVRRQLISTRTLLIGRMLRRKLGSTPTLLGATAAGFVLWRVMRAFSRKARPQVSGQAVAAKVGLLARIAEILAIVRSLLTSWPAIIFRRSGSAPAQPRPIGARLPDGTGYPPRRTMP